MLGARFNSICGINVFDVMFRPLSNGQRGEVYEVNGDRVAVILESSENKTDEGIRDEKLTELSAKPSVYWIQGIFCTQTIELNDSV